MDFGMDPEAAAHHPRIDVSGPAGVTVDQRLGEAVSAGHWPPTGPCDRSVEHAVLPV
jgi:gamma-glutamyltranspeptidase/glutathione hydrolase